MNDCSFYEDVKGRAYFLPVATIKTYQRDPRPHKFPQGCKKVRTKDGYVVYILNHYAYPSPIQEVFQAFKALTYQEAHARLSEFVSKAALVSLNADVLRLIFSFLDKFGLAAIYFTCRRFKHIAPKPDLESLCKVAPNLKWLAWLKKKGAPITIERIENQPFLGDIETLNWAYRQKIELKWNVFDALIQSMWKKTPEERLKISRFVMGLQSEHRRIFQINAALIAVCERDVELLKITVNAEFTIDRSNQVSLAEEGRLDILNIIMPCTQGIHNSLKLYLAFILLGSLKGGRKEVFDWASCLEKNYSQEDIHEIYRGFLIDAEYEGKAEIARKWMQNKNFLLNLLNKN